MNIIYNILLIIWIIIISPIAIYNRIFKKKYKGNILLRLGILTPKFSNKIEKKFKIWIHAVSVGETKAVTELIKKIKLDLPNAEIFLSSVTETGYMESQKNPLIDHPFILPFDLAFTMRRLVKIISPDLFILVETDFWFNLLKEIKRNGKKIVLINGKISISSQKKFLYFFRFSTKLFNCIDLFCLQSEEYKNRFLKLSISKEKIVVTGNIKLDSRSIVTLNDNLSFPEKKIIITIASTHEGEEDILLSELINVDDNMLFLIAPRHPERFSKVAKLLINKNIKFKTIDQQIDGVEQVILINKIGILNRCYSLSHIAIVGGSFVKNIGGHNIYEPITYNIPVLYGPYMEKQDDLVQLMQNYNVGQQVELKNLKKALLKHLKCCKDDYDFFKLQNNAQGATNKSWNLIKTILAIK